MNDKNTKVSDLVKRVVEFRDERGWKKFHTPRTLAVSIALEAAELLEHFQWELESSSAEAVRKNIEKLGEIKKEMADVLVYSISLADILGVDISDAIDMKMKHNAKKYPVKYFNNKVQDLNYYKKIKALYRSGKSAK